MRSTIDKEDKGLIPFFKKTPISIKEGDGVFVWDENGKRYIDLTSGWGVTSIGHSNRAIVKALLTQGSKIIQNPNSGLTYSPARAKLLDVLLPILPKNLTRLFFANSGAEANDASMKLARKITQKRNIVSMSGSFHGRTIGSVSATAQDAHQKKFNPLVPNHLYIPFDNIPALKSVIKNDIAAVIVEPIQGEGGVNIPAKNYLKHVSTICKENGVLLIVDEVQTGFYRTGKAFCSQDIEADFLTMAKGIAGGFPFGGFAVSQAIASQIELGDHGGTYCGNPLGCAVACAVVDFMVKNSIWQNVEKTGNFAKATIKSWQKKYPKKIVSTRGEGLLLAVEFEDGLVDKIQERALENGLIINVNKGKNIRIFPALTITHDEMKVALEILEKSFGWR